MPSFRSNTILLIILIVSFQPFRVNGDICDFCTCNNVTHTEELGIIDASEIQIVCDEPTVKKNNAKIDLENIRWPTENKTLKAHFIIHLTYLPRVLCTVTVSSIYLDNNQIDTIKSDPFQQCRNIRLISVANNSISIIPKDFLKSTLLLSELNLSMNFLSEFQADTLSHLVHLKKIDLSRNKFQTFPTEILDSLISVEELNLSGNEIVFIGNSIYGYSNYTLKRLNLANNRLTIIETTTFNSFNSLQQLNLSNNLIGKILRDSFANLSHLKDLDLSRNNLQILYLSLNDSLESLSLAENNIDSWPLINLPVNLRCLQLQQNNLRELFHTKWTVAPNLTFLNISQNYIEEFPAINLPEMTILDLSENHLRLMPPSLGQRAPKLDTLILDGNYLYDLRFNEKISLRTLSLNRIANLVLKDTDFQYLVPKSEWEQIDLSISHGERFSIIEPNALKHLNLSRLDLSYNHFSTLPLDLLDWDSISFGVDLQGNPFNCNCSEQWMLDKILNYLYANPQHQHLLGNLTCQSPAPLQGHRFVRYYNRDRAFCNLNSALREMTPPPYDGINDVVQLKLSEGPGFLIIIVTSAICLVVFILVGVFWARVERSRRRAQQRNRRLF